MRLRTKLAALAITAGVAVTASTAYAYWSQGGSGTGTASAGSTTAVTVNQTSTISGLYPGGSPVNLSGDFTNPNPGPVKVGSVTVVVDPSWSSQVNSGLPACDADDFTIGGTAVVNAEIASGANVGAWSGLTIKLDNEASNQDNCKGVTAQLIYSVTPAA